MAYRFSLATLLRLREIAEEREERLLGQILAQLAVARESLSQLQKREAASILRREDELRQRISGSELHVFYGEMRMLEELQQMARERITKFELLRVQQLKKYELAHQAREVLANMREEQVQLFHYEQGRREQNTLDDSFAARRIRR